MSRKILAVLLPLFFLSGAYASRSAFPDTSLCKYALSGPPDIDEWPQISWSDLEAKEDLTELVSGVGIKRAYKAQFNGHPVFLKVSSVSRERGASWYRSTTEVRNEAFWFHVLSEMGWAPKFYGITYYLHNNNSAEELRFYTLVTDYVEGHTISAGRIENSWKLPKKISVTPEAYQKLKEFFAFMEAREIYMHDLQLIVQPNGMWKVIDLEWYFLRSRLDPFFLKESEKYEAKKTIILNYFEDHIED